MDNPRPIVLNQIKESIISQSFKVRRIIHLRLVVFAYLSKNVFSSAVVISARYPPNMRHIT